MKKIMLVIFAGLNSLVVLAQDKLINEIQKKYIINDFVGAKQLLDQAATNPQYSNIKELWLWKSTIDGIVGQDEKTSASCPSCLESCYETFKKYEALEPSFALLADAPFRWKPVIILYENYYNKGIKAFKEKDYAASYTFFDRCVEMSKIVTPNVKKTNDIDTIPVLYAGYAAQNSKQIPQAIKYFTFLADKKYAVKEDAEMYKLLLVDFIDIKDKQNFDKYLAAAKEIFPSEDYKQYEMEFMNRYSDLDEKLKFYDKEDAKGVLTGDDYIYFGSMFSQFSKEDREMLEKNPEKKALYNTKARDAFAKAYKLTGNELMGYNVGLLYYSEYNSLDDVQRENRKKLQDLNANKPIEKDPKKKIAVEAKFKEETDAIKKQNNDLDAKMMVAVDKSIEWFEKFVNSVKDKAEKSKAEKNSLKNAVNDLINMFSYKMDKARGKDTKAYDAADAKYKFYDELSTKVKL